MPSIRRLIVLPLVLAAACAPETDPCNDIDLPRCDGTEGCAVFRGIPLGTVAGGWCTPANAVTEELTCATEESDCTGKTRYASPADADGHATDACYQYTGCEPPIGWVACDPDPTLAIGQCD